MSPSFLIHTPVHGALAVLKHFALSLTIILPRFLIIPANGIVDIAFTVLYNMQDLSLSAMLLRIFLVAGTWAYGPNCGPHIKICMHALLVMRALDLKE